MFSWRGEGTRKRAGVGLARKAYPEMRMHLIRPAVYPLKRLIMKPVIYLSQLRKDLKKEFKNLNIDTKDVDCIIMEALNCNFSLLLKDSLLTTEEIKRIMEAVKMRKEGKPVTKIFHKAYFYGLEFYVDENVLSPRPETEILVLEALKYLNENKNTKVLDLCTGSGAIACAIKKNKDVSVCATDISEKALNVAEKNAKNLGLKIRFLKSDMFNNINGKFDLILSNPPYIETSLCDTLDKEVKDYDPLLALDGGADGLDFYREIEANMSHLNDDGKLIVEIGYNQAKSVCEIFKNYKTKIIKDYGNKDRIIVVEK